METASLLDEIEEERPKKEEEKEEEEGEAENKDQQQEPEKNKDKKKGNWKNIGHEPESYELHPCWHRWKQKHPRGPCIHYKQVRWVNVPLSERLKQLAKPLLRRLLALWLEFGDKLPPEMRARLMQFLMDNYGLTEEFLNQILEEALKAQEEAEKKKKKKKKKKRRKRRRRKRKGRKGKKKKKGKKGKKGRKKKKGKKGKKSKGEKVKKVKERRDSGGLLFKKRKGGKLPLDWPYKTGCKFILACISYLSRDPDEDYHSKAPEYFDVQCMAILEVLCQNLETPLPDPEKPTQYGEALVIVALNLSHWIAKYVTGPAELIADADVEAFLNLRGEKPKIKKKKKEPAPKSKDKKGKGKKKAEPEKPPEPPKRRWEEHKPPVYVPQKSRISKRKPLEDWEGQETEVGKIQESLVVENSALEEPTLDEVKKDFLDYIYWYNPWSPEFMYDGPRNTPEGVEMFKIYDAESDEVPDDMRVLNWNQKEYGFKDDYSFIPAPVPQYYPCLRPLKPLRFEDLERSGIPREIMKKNIRFFSPWYLMRKPLRPPPPPEEPLPDDGFVEDVENEEETNEGQTTIDPTEQEEVIEDEMLEHEREPPIRDSPWGGYVMREELSMISQLMHLMGSVPDLTLEYVFELLEDFGEAVECAEMDENSTDENKILLKKRTIILEQYFLAFFGKKFRDYNNRTSFYMRLLCTRCAYFIQMLYEYTARVLWELQSRPNPPTPIPSRPETPDDPEALRDWNEWLEWLMKVTKTCDDWAGWISDTVNEAERKAAKKKGEFVGSDGTLIPLTSKEWFGWKSEVEKKVYEYGWSKRVFYRESPYYLEKSKGILPVKHREGICPWLDEEEGEGEEEAGEGEEEAGEAELEEEGGIKTEAGKETDVETEWEDVGEIEE